MKKIILIAFVLCAVVLGTRAQQLRMDTHLHVDVPMIKENMPGKDVNLRAAMEKAGMNAIGMTFAVDYVNLTYKGQAYERFMNALDGYDRILKFSNIKLTLNGKEAKENLAKGEPIVIECVEGGHFLEGDVIRLQTAYDRGLRVFCLLHDNDANPPLGDVYTNKPAYGGLTKLGADAIREAERLGMLVDLAHADSTTVMMAIRVATRPILISHTGLNTRLGNSPMAQMMKARLISPAEAKQVADAGGVIGVWPHLASSAREYAENIKAMVNIMGIDHVSIGTDSKITPEVWEKTPEMIAEEERHKKEDEKAGHKMDPAMKKMLEKDPNAVNHVWNDEPLAFYPSVVKALQEVGFNEEEIDKICGGNFLRIFTEATDQGTIIPGLNNIMTRTSIRKYKNLPVEREKVETMLRAGMAAPTAVNKQPWHFVVVTDQDIMSKIVPSRPGTKEQAPLAIVVCGDMTKALERDARDFWVQDVSASAENILLAAHALGLGAVWRGVYPIKERCKSVAEALNLPENLVPLNVITIGYPDENPTPKDKWKPENISYVSSPR